MCLLYLLLISTVDYQVHLIASADGAFLIAGGNGQKNNKLTLMNSARD
jgi:hypothetical protein